MNLILKLLILSVAAGIIFFSGLNLIVYVFIAVRDWLEHLDSVTGNRRCAAETSKTPMVILEKFIKDPCPSVRACLASNLSASDNILAVLAEDRHSGVRLAVAENKIAPVSILEKLAADRDSDVRLAVAKNKRTPVFVLEKLAADRNYYVRLAVARNENTPDSILRVLAKDRKRNVRLAVAENKNTPVDIYDEILSKDEDWEISLAALKRKQLKECIIEDQSVPRIMAGDPDTCECTEDISKESSKKR